MNDKRVSRRKRGFTYAEMLLATALLALCAGFFCDAVSFGVRQLQRRTNYSHAVILLDTLRAAVRNDLQYATAYYDDDSFERLVRDYAAKKDYAVRTWYGVGQWPGGGYADKESEMQWREIHDSDAVPGQIIRKSELFGGQRFFDCPALSESYGNLRAAIQITPIFVEDAVRKIDRFAVVVRICDGSEELANREFTVIPVQRIPYLES